MAVPRLTQRITGRITWSYTKSDFFASPEELPLLQRLDFFFVRFFFAAGKSLGTGPSFAEDKSRGSLNTRSSILMSAVMAFLILVVGGTSIQRMGTNIFPEIALAVNTCQF